MPYVPMSKIAGKENSRLYSVTEAAKIVGINPQTFWAYVHYDGLFPTPATKVGNRFFYSENQFQNLLGIVAKLKTDGTIKINQKGK